MVIFSRNLERTNQNDGFKMTALEFQICIPLIQSSSKVLNFILCPHFGIDQIKVLKSIMIPPGFTILSLRSYIDIFALSLYSDDIRVSIAYQVFKVQSVALYTLYSHYSI